MAGHQTSPFFAPLTAFASGLGSISFCDCSAKIGPTLWGLKWWCGYKTSARTQLGTAFRSGNSHIHPDIAGRLLSGGEKKTMNVVSEHWGWVFPGKVGSDMRNFVLIQFMNGYLERLKIKFFRNIFESETVEHFIIKVYYWNLFDDEHNCDVHGILLRINVESYQFTRAVFPSFYFRLRFNRHRSPWLTWWKFITLAGSIKRRLVNFEKTQVEFIIDIIAFVNGLRWAGSLNLVLRYDMLHQLK